MLIQCLNAPEFTVAENGEITRSARWLLCAEADDGDFAVAAMLWAGAANGDWRVPNAAGDGYTPDHAVRIGKVDCKVIDAGSCEIHYTGLPRLGAVTRVPGAFRFERRANLEEYQYDSFRVPAEAFNTFLPAIGQSLNWNGGVYVCESAEARLELDGNYRIDLTAVNTAVRAEGEITTEDTAEFESLKQGVWLVTPSALAEFLTAHAIHADASAWAGEGFYIHHVATAPAHSGNRTQVTLQARHAALKLIEARRTERLAAFGSSETAEKEIIWTGRWRVTAQDRAIFENQLGASAAEWAEENFIISRITPERVSDCEYEYTLEARLPETILSDNTPYWHDRDLPDRNEFYARVGEIRFTPRQCGYCWSYLGQYVLLANWSPSAQCPLVTTVPLDPRWINQGVKLLEVVAVNYLAGPSGRNLSTIRNWLAGAKVVRATLAGITGNWLKVDLNVDDLTDSRDRRWTRITKIYRQPPAQYEWNSLFWV